MEADTIVSILKWICLAFVAGLLGYFGKHLGKIIISRFSKEKRNVTIASQKADKHLSHGDTPDESPVISPNPSTQKEHFASYNEKTAKSTAKLEKKRLKAQRKKQKKSFK